MGKILVVFSAFLIIAVNICVAVPPPAAAQCRITCTVAEVVEWSQTSFPDIDLGELNRYRTQAVGESALKLYTNGDVIITADNSSNAQLTSGDMTLQTEYQLRCNGSQEISTEWCTYDTFLKNAAEIMHRDTFGAVVVTLSVKAAIAEFKSGNTGQYNATQTLTACWKS